MSGLVRRNQTRFPRSHIFYWNLIWLTFLGRWLLPLPFKASPGYWEFRPKCEATSGACNPAVYWTFVNPPNIKVPSNTKPSQFYRHSHSPDWLLIPEKSFLFTLVKAERCPGGRGTVFMRIPVPNPASNSFG